MDIREFREEEISPQGGGVLLQPDFARYIDGPRYMPEADLDFFKGLLAEYGIRHDTSEPGMEEKPFGREQFFEAIAKLRKYSESVRDRVDAGIPDAPIPASEGREQWEKEYEMYARLEDARPSSRRLGNLNYLFLHTPQIKDVYDHFHAEKMARAFPDFITELSGFPMDEIPDRASYLEQVRSLMDVSMERIVNTYPVDVIDNLGSAMTYAGFRYRLWPTMRSKSVVSSGLFTFVNFLEQLANGAQDRAQFQEAIEREFKPAKPENEGLARRLMKTSLRSFNRMFRPWIKLYGLHGTRAMMSDKAGSVGRCPAMLRGRTEGGQLTERPVSLEYATMIGRMMPPRLFARR